MTTEDSSASSEPSKATAGSPSSSTSTPSATKNSNKPTQQRSVSPDSTTALCLEEIVDGRYRSYSFASEGSQDSGTALLPEVTFSNSGGPLNSFMGSPSRHINRENQPLLGSQRCEVEDFNIWQGRPRALHIMHDKV